jgi:hypothetical protein
MDHDHHDHTEHEMGHSSLETKREYVKFALVIAGIFIASLLITWSRGGGFVRFLNDFMATFFITFAAFKFINLEMFVAAYRGYDILAKNFRPWAYMFPFIEAILGFAFLLTHHNQKLEIVTIIITGIAGYGVVKELRKKSKIMCACLGTVIRLPLSKVSFVEDFLMLVMAAGMLLFV